MIILKLKNFLGLLLNIIIFAVAFCVGLFPFSQHPRAAVAPNEQYGKCGPYYLWYQVGPDSLRYSGDYIDLCEITFDISDVIDDFDFVYFTERRALLDKNRDGISDQYFYFPPENQNKENQNKTQLKWKPDGGCVRINLWECWGTTFNENCGYSMISIQPKPGHRNGRAKIPVRVTKRCPPHGVDCSETVTIFHDYSDCFTLPSPDFIVHKKVDVVFFVPPGYGRPEAKFPYTITVHNAGEKKGGTVLTDTVTNGTNGGTLVLSELEIVCPPQARCTVSSMSTGKFQISLQGLLVNETATIKYTLTGNPDEVPKEEVSYFTNTAILSSGSLSQVTVGIRGRGEFLGPRPERPRPRGQ